MCRSSDTCCMQLAGSWMWRSGREDVGFSVHCLDAAYHQIVQKERTTIKTIYWKTVTFIAVLTSNSYMKSFYRLYVFFLFR